MGAALESVIDIKGLSLTFTRDGEETEVLRKLDLSVGRGEFLAIVGPSGVGQRMMQASSLLATDIVVVYMLTMAALYGLLDTLFVAVQKWMLRWKA